MTPGPPVVDYDVVIIGAGPSGSTAAIAYKQAKPDLRIALVDKATFPREKACGDGLGPGVLGVLEDLGLSTIVDGGNQVNAVEVRGPRGTSVGGALPALADKGGFGVVIERRTFDHRLHQAAIEVGVSDFSGWRFAGGDIVGDARIVDLSRPGERVTISTSLLVGADGASSRVRASLGVTRNTDRHTGVGIRAYATVLTPARRPTEALMLDFQEELNPGYGWVFPLRDGRANIGVFMVAANRKKLGLKTTDLLRSFVGQLEAGGYRVSDLTSARTYLLPYTPGLPTLAYERAALIGDAASMINPWSGEGIFYGMEAGRLLAAETAEDLRSGEDAALGTGLQRFEDRFRRRFSQHLKTCHLAHRVTRSKRISAGILRVAKRERRVFDYLVSLMFEEAGCPFIARGRTTA
ncbi:MAG: geranylgeranyl reductase family protein [Acidimicrobiia bacterium]